MNLKKVKPKPNLLCTNRNIVRFEDFTGVLQLGITHALFMEILLLQPLISTEGLNAVSVSKFSGKRARLHDTISSMFAILQHNNILTVNEGTFTQYAGGPHHDKHWLLL